MPELLIWLILIGCLSGFLAGLLGIGGGIIVVPALLWLFPVLHVAPDLAMHMAIGTSLAIMMFTVFSSVFMHYRYGNIVLDLVARLLPGIIVGVLLGTVLASVLSGLALIITFVVYLLFVAIYLWREWPHQQQKLPNRFGLIMLGCGQSSIAALLGIGGSTVLMPLLVWFGVKVRKAMATSALCNMPVAILGSIGFIIIGWHQPGLPTMSLGYIYLPAMVIIGLASMVLAPFGARLSQHLPSVYLRRLFAMFLVLVALMLLFK